MHTIRFRYISTAEHFTPCQHHEDSRQRLPTLTQLYCWNRHVASFLNVWKGSQSDPNYLDKQNNSLLIPFLSLKFFYMLPERRGASFLFTFLYVNFNENACSEKRGGRAWLSLMLRAFQAPEGLSLTRSSFLRISTHIYLVYNFGILSFMAPSLTDLLPTSWQAH